MTTCPLCGASFANPQYVLLHLLAAVKDGGHGRMSDEAERLILDNWGKIA